ncbi:hypothetical protein OsI_01966 [Oryza sativa Indica Group]|uniref:glutathione transferase n=1 Tax=Oryza sativa subsp. indica TaxID=39946 RepID=B8A891_ORYSI|nr:hypothetical protein OsI_01966 [Oryza sativa Indica Group]
MAPVKVFGPAMSTNVARVLVCLEEVGVEYELVNIDFKAMEHKSPEHLKRNPFGQDASFPGRGSASLRSVVLLYSWTGVVNSWGDIMRTQN